MAQRAFKSTDDNLPGAPDAIVCDFAAFEGLVGAFFFGDGGDWITENWGNGDNAQIVGTPTIRDGYASFDGANYLQTDVSETLAMTLVTVARGSGPNTIGLVGNYGGGTQYGVSLFVNGNATTISSSSSRTGVGGSGGIGTSSDTTKWGLYIGTIPEQGQTRIDAPTTGGANLGGSGPRVLTGLGKLRIGGGPSPSFVGANDQLMTLVFNRAITADERTRIVALARDYAASKGIVV